MAGLQDLNIKDVPTLNQNTKHPEEHGSVRYLMEKDFQVLTQEVEDTMITVVGTEAVMTTTEEDIIRNGKC
jgi:hypothetical protein